MSFLFEAFDGSVNKKKLERKMVFVNGITSARCSVFMYYRFSVNSNDGDFMNHEHNHNNYYH